MTQRHVVSISGIAALCLAGALALGASRKSSTPTRGANQTGQTGKSGQVLKPDQGGADSTSSWTNVDRLVSEQKLAEASEGIEKILNAARQRGDEPEWTKALIRWVGLRTALHGPETAVRFLMEQPWPKGALQRTVLELYYAHALVNYAQSYGWEIGQRERVASTATVDLKAWTRDQIYEAAGQAYARIWKDREALGREPVRDLGTWIVPNDYPAGIRPALRDAVGYLFAAMLADAGGWRPEQSAELYRLDLRALVAGDPARSRQVAVADASVHPLVRLGAVLDDLEAWHLQQGEREAALEAHLTRVGILHATFTQADDKALVVADLTKRLQRDESLPWASMGMAELAELVRQETAPDALVRAHRIAQRGAAAHPGSPGARRCQAIVQQIEQPAYALRTMRLDGPRRRSILVTHRNVSALTLRAYAVDLDAQLSRRRDYDLLPSQREMQELVRSAKPAAEWRVELPATPDYRLHQTWVVPPLDKLGLYVIVASSDARFRGADVPVVGTRFTVSDLVAVVRLEQGDAVEVQILSGETGRPVPGASVELWKLDWQKGHRKLQTRTVSDDGTARFDLSPDTSCFLVARHGADVALAATQLYVGRRERPGKERNALVYTDRAIYRPLQKVFFKVIAYQGVAEQARLTATPGAKISVTLRDANGEPVAEQSLRTNDFGTAAGEFTLPAGRLLGSWSIGTDWSGAAGIRVEEYKRPTFEVSLQEPKEALRLNRPARLRGEARYYFGLPVTNGQVRWKVSRQPVYPFWAFWWGAPRNEQSQVMATGVAALKDDGTFELEFEPRADERAGAEVSFRFRAEVDVTDEGGETRSAERSFRLGQVTVEARVDLETQFGREGTPATWTVVRTDLDGSPRPGKGTWLLTALHQPPQALLPADQPLPAGASPQVDGEESDGEPQGPRAFATPGDRLRPRWEANYQPAAVLRSWSEGRELARGDLVHGERGEAKLALPGLAPGAYRITYRTQDAFGAAYELKQDWVVAGRAIELRVPAYLAAERPTVKVGETARLLVHSGLPGEVFFLERLRAGRRISLQALRSGKDPALIEIPITEQDRGGFACELVVERDHQLIRLQARVAVPWDDRELQVSFSSFRDRLQPGAKETWRVTVKGPPGARPEAAAAELLAYMYDRSLDAFAPHSAPSPMSLWPDRTQPQAAMINLGVEVAWNLMGSLPGIDAGPSFTPDRLHFEDGYGIGGPGRRVRLGDMMHDGPVNRSRLPMAAPPPSPSAMAAPAARGEAMARNAAKMEFAAEKAKQPGEPSGGSAEAAPVRSNFAETAFWVPQLRVGLDGSSAIEFTVPDSVTSWVVFVQGVTRDLWSGSVQRQARSVKDLMVRPYVPRFLREGDVAELKVVVSDATDQPMSGKVRLEVTDADTHQDLAAAFGLSPAELEKPFQAPKQGSTSLTFRLAAPRQVLTAAIKVVADAGSLSDGELRPVPVLPGRVHLAQSRFVTLRDRDQRTMRFEDLSKPDPTRVNEQLVVTVDAQLLYSVLSALPYLLTYPYECTEQTLNRFLSTGIVTSVFRAQPAIAKMAKELSRRDTPLEPFDAADPNRKMTLEESPWLAQSRGDPLDPKSAASLVRVLDPEIAAAQQNQSLEKLRKAQLASGAFPWFPGGPPSPFMTLYLLHGFARAAEFGVPVPKEMVVRAWGYVAEHVRAETLPQMRAHDCCWEFLTFVNYVATAFPDRSWTEDGLTDAERQELLAFSFRHWKQHSPYLKGYLALTLKRMGREADARLVWASVMDSAKTAPDQGTFWAQEDRSWLWYNDTIETHAFALRTLMELDPANPKKDGMVLWLMLNKKLNQWKSTRATAEVIYSLVHYMKKEGQLGVREVVDVTAGGERKQFVFEPDRYTGKGNRVVVPGEKVSAQTATVKVEKETPGLAFASATWMFSTEQLPAEARGDFFSVTRRYFLREGKAKEAVLRPLEEGNAVKVGDEVEVQLSIRVKHAAEYVHLRDPRGAGFEPVSQVSRYQWDLGIAWYEEIRDSGTNFFFESLPQGEYTFKYRVRANMAGAFRIGPATLQSIYAPEFNAYSAGAKLEVKGG